MRGRPGLRLLLFAYLTGAATALFGAEQEPADVRIFPAAFFADAQPRTALDLLARVPGFTLDTGDDDVRGYSGSTGNVLIDAQRPASKYGGLADLLQQIPAASVERIELIRGAAPGLDMQGQSVVANVIRREDLSTHASAEVGVYIHGDGRRLPEARLDRSQRSTERLFEATLHAYEFADDDGGNGFRRRVDADGQLLRYAESEIVASTKGIAATLSYERTMAGGKLRITSSLLAEDKGEAQDITTTFPDSDFASIVEDKETRQGELGAHYERAAGTRSRLELLAIQQLSTSDKTENEIGGSGFARFLERSDSGETILRAVIRTPLAASRAVEWGAETAFNFLQSESSGQENGIPVPLPAARVRVEERRGEAFGIMSWSPRSTIAIEVGAAFEFSNISQRRDTESSKSLTYLKPRAQLAWTPSSVNQLRLSLQRNVGQLDFDDFVSSAELSTGTLDVGNADLEPATSWDLIASWERQIWRDSTAVISLHRAQISDVVDIVPIYADTDGDGIDEFFEGPGNIGSGVLNELQLELNVPLQQFGIPGGLLKSNLTYRHSSVTDPLTGARRSIIDMKQPWEGEIEFFQDRPAQRLRWGIGVTLGDEEPEFRSDETRKERDRSWLEVFAEFFPAPKWTLRLELQNISSRENRLTRTRYDAPRDNGAIEAVDIEAHEFERYAHLAVRRDFR